METKEEQEMKVFGNCKHSRTETKHRGNVIFQVCKDCNAHRIKNIILLPEEVINRLHFRPMIKINDDFSEVKKGKEE